METHCFGGSDARWFCQNNSSPQNISPYKSNNLNIVVAHYSQNFIILALDNKAVMVAIFETIVEYRLCYFALKHILWVLIGIASARLFQ